MKFRFVRNKQTRHRELVIYSQKGESINPSQANWRNEPHDDNILPLTYHIDPDYKVELYYDVEGLVSFKSYIKKFVLTTPGLISMLTDFSKAYGSCTSGQNRQFWERALLFDERYVFVDADGRLYFVFVPLDGVPFSANNSPLTLIRQLSETGKARYDTPNDAVLAQHLADYELNERGVFSFNTFRAFLREECGVDVQPDGTIFASTTQASAGGMAGGSGYGGGYGAYPSRGGMGVQAPPYTPTPYPSTPASYPSTAGSEWQTGGMSSRQGVYPSMVPGVDMANLVQRERERSQGGMQQAPAAAPGGRRCLLYRLATGQAYAFGEGQQILLGRGSSCTPQLLGNYKISRNHATVLVNGGMVQLTDLGSRNGSFVNGAALTPNLGVSIPVGQHFFLGSEEFVVSYG